MPAEILRTCEWAKVETHALTSAQREQLNAAVLSWAQQQHLSSPPLSFSGPHGELLCATQYVGVVEIDDVAIEIHPKLDSALLAANQSPLISNQARVTSVMRNLLWMLEVAEHREVVEAAVGHLEEMPTTFFDLFAYLLGKNLLHQLMAGVSHNYVTYSDDLTTVRGRIRLGDQLSRNWDRLDRIACTWDEFTSNTPANRLFKCACRFLAERVSYNEAARLLIDCLTLLDHAQDVSPRTALRDVESLRFDRSMDRFRLAFDLATRLLKASGHALGAGGANTYVFLIDMNELFQNYVHAGLEARFQTIVKQQECVGHLLKLAKGRVAQYADYFWRSGPDLWIGDAKYKHLAAGHTTALRFTDLPDTNADQADAPALAGYILNAGDIRQLTVYAELARRTYTTTSGKVSLALLYPFVGADSQCLPDHAKAWNDSHLWLIPVRVVRQTNAVNILPPLAEHNQPKVQPRA
jgi:5-methylcytosine-specific restriction endonuclease McrBC regulatory subunit McrC